MAARAPHPTAIPGPPEPRTLGPQMGVQRKPLSAAEQDQWKEVAARLTALRGARSKASVARAVGVTPKAYAAWEQAVARISDAKLLALAEFYGVSEGYILYGQDKPVRLSQLDRIERRLDDILSRLPDAELLREVRELQEQLRDTEALQTIESDATGSTAATSEDRPA